MSSIVDNGKCYRSLTIRNVSHRIHFAKEAFMHVRDAACLRCFAERDRAPTFVTAQLRAHLKGAAPRLGHSIFLHPIATPPPIVRFSTCVVFSIRSAAEFSAA